MPQNYIVKITVSAYALSHTDALAAVQGAIQNYNQLQAEQRRPQRIEVESANVARDRT
jgi:hypothetical protein